MKKERASFFSQYGINSYNSGNPMMMPSNIDQTLESRINRLEREITRLDERISKLEGQTNSSFNYTNSMYMV